MTEIGEIEMHAKPWGISRLTDWAFRARILPGRRRAAFWELALRNLERDAF